MITITVVLLALVILGAVACLLPVLALPLLDIVVGIAIIYYLIKLIKKLFKKKG